MNREPVKSRILPKPHPALSLSRPQVFAHRGGSKLRPENTTIAFDHGLSLGADGLEFDVHLSRDGVVVVHHDSTLERTTDRTGPLAALTADDVVFSFTVYLDAKVNSPKRDLLIIGDKPIAVTKVSPLAVRFDLPGPYAPGDRLFDSFWILPKHKLERPYAEGRLAQMWSLAATPDFHATGMRQPELRRRDPPPVLVAADSGDRSERFGEQFPQIGSAGCGDFGVKRQTYHPGWFRGNRDGGVQDGSGQWASGPDGD